MGHGVGEQNQPFKTTIANSRGGGERPKYPLRNGYSARGGQIVAFKNLPWCKRVRTFFNHLCHSTKPTGIARTLYTMKCDSIEVK